MEISCQFSLYLLGPAAIGPALERALDELDRAKLTYEVGNMSTQCSGELQAVLQGLGAAFARMSETGPTVLVATISNACPVAPAE